MHSAVVPLPLDPDQEAREALAAGDVRAAVTVLMRAYGEAIYRHCLAVVADRALADDVHQTVFVQAYRDLPGWQGRSSLRTWLYAIARHRCLDALKQRQRRWRRLVPWSGAPEPVDERTDTASRLTSPGTVERLARALLELPPEVRVAVLLRYREELSYDEMSEICGERPATLQARVARAMPKLRRLLEKGGRR